MSDIDGRMIDFLPSYMHLVPEGAEIKMYRDGQSQLFIYRRTAASATQTQLETIPPESGNAYYESVTI